MEEESNLPVRKKVNFATEIQERIIGRVDDQDLHKSSIEVNPKNKEIQKLTSKSQVISAFRSGKLSQDAIPKFRRKNSANPFLREINRIKTALEENELYKKLDKKSSDLGDHVNKFTLKHLPESTHDKYRRSIKELEQNTIKLDDDKNIVQQLKDKDIDLDKFKIAMEMRKMNKDESKNIVVKIKDENGKNKFVKVNPKKFREDKLALRGKNQAISLTEKKIPNEIKKDEIQVKRVLAEEVKGIIAKLSDSGISNASERSFTENKASLSPKSILKKTGTDISR